MFDLKAKAYQTRTGIYVDICGLLANTCMRAKVEGTYPGTIIHIVDPGHGEVFIHEWREPGMEFCAEHLVPWHEHAILPGDFGHKSVVIYVNGEKKLEVPVEGRPVQKLENQWIVTALVGGPPGGPFKDCAVRPADAIYPAIYHRVFGPDSKAACEAFKAKQCQPIDM